MAMKKTDLEKNKALKLTHSMKQTRSERFGTGTAEVPANRREQRKVERGRMSHGCAPQLKAGMTSSPNNRIESIVCSCGMSLYCMKHSRRSTPMAS